MNTDVVKAIIEKAQTSMGKLVRHRIASIYTIYKTIAELKEFGIISYDNGKIVFLENPSSSTFKRLFNEGFDIEILSKKNVKFFLSLLEPKTIQEISQEINKSIAQTNRRLKKLSQFLHKEGNKYRVSKSNPILYDFLELLGKKKYNQYTWEKNGERLLKTPTSIKQEGTLTGFSRFAEFGVAIIPSHNYIFQPVKEISLEEIMIHAIKFSQNANDLALCIIFYLKNKKNMDAHKIEKNCEKFGVMPIWLDMLSYLEDQPVKNPKMFLPRNELLEKAKIYGLKLKNRFHKNIIEDIFDKLEKELTEPVKIFMIGGNALIEYNLKNSTKDIDLVTLANKEAIEIVRTLKKIGFKEVGEKDTQYFQLGTSTMLEKEAYPRIDLFLKKICNALELSKNMLARSKKIRTGKLSLYVASLEDIFLLKSVSSRDSDLIDCENILMQSKLDWNLILEEIISQEKNLNNSEMTILDHFEVLEKRLGIKIPITSNLLDISIEKAILFLAKKPISVAEILQKINFPETTIRNKIQSLVKKGKIKKIHGKPFKIVVK